MAQQERAPQRDEDAIRAHFNLRRADLHRISDGGVAKNLRSKLPLVGLLAHSATVVINKETGEVAIDGRETPHCQLYHKVGAKSPSQAIDAEAGVLVYPEGGWEGVIYARAPADQIPKRAVRHFQETGTSLITDKPYLEEDE